MLSWGRLIIESCLVQIIVQALDQAVIPCSVCKLEIEKAYSSYKLGLLAICDRDDDYFGQKGASMS